MTFAGLNYVAIVAAAIAAFIVGGIWYGALSRQWLAALGKTQADFGSSTKAMIVTFLAELVMAHVLAGLLGHLGEVSLRTGIISGAFVWAGFVATTFIVNYSHQRAKPALYVIDLGHWLVALAVMGGVIGWFGV